VKLDPVRLDKGISLIVIDAGKLGIRLAKFRLVRLVDGVVNRPLDRDDRISDGRLDGLEGSQNRRFEPIRPPLLSDGQAG
jgi:hypothetical protein